MVREEDYGMLAWDRSKWNIFFFFEVMARLSLVCRPWAKSQWITDQWEESEQTRTRGFLREGRQQDCQCKQENNFGGRPAVFREKWPDEATGFPWFGSSSLGWIVYSDITGMCLRLYVTFDTCLSHHSQERFSENSWTFSISNHWRVKSKLSAWDGTQSPPPVSAFPPVLRPPAHLPVGALALLGCTRTTDTNPVLSFHTSASTPADCSPSRVL